ncbi:MAG TPA: flagellar filament capping protein FliD [Candidatus Methylacidiphilales bacterium]
MSVTIGGTFSGLDVSSIISSIIAADSVPITNLQTEDTTLTSDNTDLANLGTSLGNLSTVLQALTPTLLSSQSATSSVPAVGTASVDSTATPGTVSVDVTQLATTTVLRGGTTGGAFADAKLTAPSAGDTAIGTVLNESDVDGQTFTINGKQITLASTDVLDDGNPDSTASVIGKINNSGAGVTATYDSTTGDISLSSSSPILLGSGSDTSDFLQQAQLFNNGTDSVTSTTGLGRIDPTTDLTTAGLRTTLTPGTFSINGVSITYSSGDSLNALISQINSSAAGVTAMYDSYDDQMVLSSKQQGPQSITVADGTGNIATALRLTSSDSQLEAGKPTLYTVNGSSTVRQSDTNLINSSALGLTGVTFSATGTGTTQISVAPDVTNIAAAINAFITQYNTTQTTIADYTHVDTADVAKNGPLATDTNLTFLAPDLRSVTSGSTSSTAAIRMLSDLGIDTNANDNTLTDVNTTDLQNALTNNLPDVIAMFEDPTTGLTNTIQNTISQYNDSLNGSLVNEENANSAEITFNQSQITRMQEQIAVEKTNLENQFAALDSQEALNEQLTGILNGNSSSSSSSGSTSSTSTSTGSVGSS